MSQQLTRLTQQLVRALIPELDDGRARNELVRQSVRDLRNTSLGGGRKEWEDVKITLDGLSNTAKIRIQNDLADAIDQTVDTLERCWLKSLNDWDGIGGIEIASGSGTKMKIEDIPQYIHLLLNLAKPPNMRTHEYANSYLNRLPPIGPTEDQILFKKIMSENPYDEGETYDEEVKNGWTDSQSDSDSFSDSRSSMDDEEDSPEEEQVRTPSSIILRKERQWLIQERKREEAERRFEDALQAVRKFEGESYWLEKGVSISGLPEGLYGWKQMTTSVTSAAIAHTLCNDPSASNKIITSQQFQRELIFALSGRPGIIFNFTSDAICSISPDHPQVQHSSPRALSDVLETFQHWASQAAHIRSFVKETLRPHPPQTQSSTNPHRKNDQAKMTTNKTQQAFAEACRCEMQKYDMWLADLEAAFLRGNSASKFVATPLTLRHEVAQRASILSHLMSLIPHSDSPTLLLNLIHATIVSLQQQQMTSLVSQDLVALLKIFVQTVQPTWLMLKQWIQYGMPIPSALQDTEEGYASTDLEIEDERAFDSEFFLKRDRDVSWVDEDFWEAGWVVDSSEWPSWLGEDVGEIVLEAGKARGLLQSLSGWKNDNPTDEWADINILFRDASLENNDQDFKAIDIDIRETIEGYLRPTCQVTQFHLRRVLDDECGLEQHLDAIEGMMFMIGHEVMHEWQEWLFAKVQSGNGNENDRWPDFQVLTYALRDTIDRRCERWMNPSALRIRTIKSKQNTSMNSPRALGIIRADYEVPFPLSQLFTPTSMDLRSEVFTFLLQVQLGRYILGNTKPHDKDLLEYSSAVEEEVKMMLGMRQKLTWFLDTLYTWITQRIISTRTEEYRKKLGEKTSLRLMINLELKHTREIRDYCFLHPKDEDILEAILSVLDMSQTVVECFHTHLAERRASKGRRTPIHLRSNNITRKRSRRRRTDEHNGSSSGSEEEEDEGNVTSISFSDQSLYERMKRMSEDLEDVVVDVRDGVDRLVMDVNREGDDENRREGWETLAFALEEWR